MNYKLQYISKNGKIYDNIVTMKLNNYNYGYREKYLISWDKNIPLCKGDKILVTYSNQMQELYQITRNLYCEDDNFDFDFQWHADVKYIENIQEDNNKKMFFIDKKQLQLILNFCL